MQRTATAVWNGTLREGAGTISSQSGVLTDSPYSFATRFESAKGTNPEELIAAAHAGCFTMALDAQLSTMHFTPEKLRTIATVTLDKVDSGWAITKVHLDVAAQLRGISSQAFEAAAVSAKENCPVSKLLKAEISMTAHLEQAA
ncbi:MAG TPA: OsmC family protein [Candidatus Baltobacteraceae bacterium]|nr:OsmC family protein [Candidatus Baltobacteraceae bacterium]